MKTIKTDVYTYDELSKDAQERARDWYKEIDDLPFLSEYMQELAVELLEKYGMTECTDIKTFYSLAWCQGDGAMVEFDGTYKGYSVVVKHEGRYEHYNSKHIDMMDCDGNYVECAIQDAFNADVYVPMCKELERAGYAYIDAETDNDNVAHNIRANEYTFTADGVRFG